MTSEPTDEMVEAAKEAYLSGGIDFGKSIRLALTAALAVQARDHAWVPKQATEQQITDGLMTWTMPWDSVIPAGVDPDRYIVAMVYGSMVNGLVPPDDAASEAKP